VRLVVVSVRTNSLVVLVYPYAINRLDVVSAVLTKFHRELLSLIDTLNHIPPTLSSRFDGERFFKLFTASRENSTGSPWFSV
jgi:hypothetical protein